MLKRALPIILAMAVAVPLAGCVAAEVAAAPVLVPAMVAGDLYSGHRAGQTPDWRAPKRDMLKTPGAYQFFAAAKPDAAAQLTINPDRSVKFDGFDCALSGTPRADLTRQVPGDWRPGQVYQVVSATGACSAASGGRVYIQARLHLAAGVSSQDFPFGNHVAISLWPERCCSMMPMSFPPPSPWPDFVRVEVHPS